MAVRPLPGGANLAGITIGVGDYWSAESFADHDAAPTGPTWGLGDVLAALLLGEAISAVVGLIWLAATGTPVTAVSVTTPPTGFLLATEVGLWAGFGGVPAYAAIVKGSGSIVKDFGLRLRPWPDVPLGIVLGVLAQFAVDLLYMPLAHLIPGLSKSLSQPTTELFGGRGDRGYFLITLLVAVGAPIFEELLFRGLLLRSLQRRFSKRSNRWAHWIPLVGSAAIFALMHLEPADLLGLFLVGLLLGELAIRSKRLGPGMVTHASFNLVAVVLTFVGQHH
jgi:membrane protease YdiL (CAAX protease family)